MAFLTDNPLWFPLQQAKKEIDATTLAQLFAQQEQRFKIFSREAAGLYLDFSKNLLSEKTFNLLIELAHTCQVETAIEALFSNKIVNSSEQQSALHTALRNPNSNEFITAGLAKMQQWVEGIHHQDIRGCSGQAFTDVVNIGIGGSDLGVRLMASALKEYKQSDLNLHFITNIDEQVLENTLAKLNPATTLFIVVSKSFSTRETLFNLQKIKTWLHAKLSGADAWRQHLLAVTANVERAQQHGFSTEQILPLLSAVGGRYSIWSSVALPVALQIGMPNFLSFLTGAYKLDQHVKNTNCSDNLAVILSVLEIWYRNFFHTQSHAIIPYCQKLADFPAYLQQLVMESNGKSVSNQGEALTYATSPVIWGQVGTNGQHSFMQCLHQGQDMIPVDFIFVSQDGQDIERQQFILANALSQSRLLMLGKSYASAYEELIQNGTPTVLAKTLAAHRVLPGNRPSNTLILQNLTPEQLGSLIALYEHKVYISAFIWNINAFDQWGVEAGKVMAEAILNDLKNPPTRLHYDGSTNGLISKIQELEEIYAKK